MSCRVLGRQVEPTTLNLSRSRRSELGAQPAGRRVHPDEEERHGEGSLCEAWLHGDDNDAGRRQPRRAGSRRVCPVDTFIHVSRAETMAGEAEIYAALTEIFHDVFHARRCRSARS